MRVMRAEVGSLDRRAAGCKLSSHSCIQFKKSTFREHAPRNAGLVRDDKKQIASLMEAFGCIQNSGNPVPILLGMNVTVVNVDYAIPVEKGCFAHERSGSNQTAEAGCAFLRYSI